MRDFKGMKRQRGRNRGGGGQSGGNKQQHNVNRAFDSNGPDGVKIRGHAQHVYEKYQQLARDASGAGDRVLAENYLQHAEHYFRVLRAVQPQRPVAEIIGRDNLSVYEIDFEDESGGQAFVEAPELGGGEGEGQGDQSRGEYQPRQDNQNRQDNRQDGQQREWRDRNRDRDRDNNQPRQDNQNRQDRGEGPQPRQDRPRDDRNFDRPRNRDRDRDRNREERNEPAMEPEAAPMAAAAAPAPDGFALRDADGAMSPAPAFLQARPAPVAAEPEDGEKKPRRTRRRAPRAGFEGGEEGSAPVKAEEA